MEATPAVRRETFSTVVIERVAAKAGVDPLDLDPLYEVIDPDALDALVGPDATSGRSPVRIEFRYCGYEVLVTSDGEIRVTTET